MASGGKKVVLISAKNREDAAAKVSSAGGAVVLELASCVYGAIVPETLRITESAQTKDGLTPAQEWLESGSNYGKAAWETLAGREITPIERPVPFTKKGRTALAIIVVSAEVEEYKITDSELSDVLAGLWAGALKLYLSYPDESLHFTFEPHHITISPSSQVPLVGLTSWPSAVPFQDQLYCFYQGIRSDRSKLFYNVFDPSTGTWKGISEVPNTTVTDGPSAVVFNNKLYVLHSGPASRREVWYNVFDGTSWAGDVRIWNTRITGGPSALEHNGKLYCFHQGYINNENEFWYNVYDGNTWVGDKLVTDTKISGSPSAVVFKDHIYCFYQGVEDLKNTLLVNRFDPQTEDWSGHVQIPYSNSITTQGPPSAVAFDDKMYVFHQSGENGGLWFNTSPDGSLWRGVTPLTPARSAEGLATTVFRNELYCFYQGADTNFESLMYRSFGKGSLGWEQLWAGPALRALGYESFAELAEAVRVKFDADDGYVVCVTKFPLLYSAYADETRLCIQFPTNDIATTFAKIFDATGVYDNSNYPSSYPRYTFALPSGDNDEVPVTSYATGFVFHQGAGGNKGTRLWLSLLDRRTASWTEMQGPVTTLSGGGPAAVFLSSSKLYVLYQVDENGGELYYNIFDGVTWKGETKVPDIQGASGSPGAVFFRGALHFFYQGSNDNGQLWHGVVDPETNTWQGETQLALEGYSRISLGPSPAVFLNNVYNLYNGSVATRPADGSRIAYNRVRVNIFNGSEAIRDMQVPNTYLTGEPSAVVFNNILYAFHQGNKNDGTLWCNTTDGIELWNGDTLLEPGLLISDGPSAMALEDNLYCFVQGRGKGLDDTLFYKVLDESNAWGELRILPTSSGIGEQHRALAVGSLCIIYSSTPPTVERVI